MKFCPPLFALLAVVFLAVRIDAAEPIPNSMPYPRPILQSQVDLTVTSLSHDALEMAELLKLTPLFNRLKTLRDDLGKDGELPLKRLEMRQDILELKQEITESLVATSMEVDFVLAEINEEQIRASELSQSLATQRDRNVAITNAVSFCTNGALWALAEGLSIPTYRRPRFSISSGTTGILAGLVPSAFSIYALKQLSGRHFVGTCKPNMLAKLFDYPTSPQIEYPKSVWDYLNAVPPDDNSGLTRRVQIINRWIEDRNMPYFKDKKSREQIDYVTGFSQPDVTIAKIQARTDMLQQLSAEIFKMNRTLLELMMVIRGTKDFPS